MDVHLISVSSIIILCFFLTILPPSYCDKDDGFVVCNRSYTCGSLNISYPFWGDSQPEYCGGHQGYKLSCHNNESAVIRIEALDFRVLNINPSNRSFTIARSDLRDGPCPRPPKLQNTTLNYTLFDYAQNVQNVTIFYGCPPHQDNNIQCPNTFNCSQEVVADDGKMNAYLVEGQYPLNDELLLHLTEVCENNIKVPILRSSATALLADPQGGAAAVLRAAIDKGFEVEYSSELAALCRPCEALGGVCGSNSTQPFLCFCPDQVQSFTICPPKPRAGMHPCSLLSSHFLGLRFFAVIVLAL